MTDDRTLHGQTLALAGMYQAASLVQQTARGQTRDPQATAASLGSIFMTSPGHVDDVYRDVNGIRLGLSVLSRQLGTDNSARDLELTGYVITLLHLERKLSGARHLLDNIASGLDAIRGDSEYGPEMTADVVSALAGIYASTVSTLTPRIMVQGEPGILQATESRDMIRALLLAGMRAAVLWRQCGGSRIRLLFKRKAMLAHTNALLRGS
ncbi:MAG TPA: high frequency lysogenization protein HflD [Gammaproteobacteria bacterium]|jgi:high frequency lysogenization protein|nr:high frequency lysogenization protein HflD [Gammaproteobacteria bacterium]